MQLEAAKLGANGLVLSNLDRETFEREHSFSGGNQGGRIKEQYHVVHVHALAVYVSDAHEKVNKL